MLTVTSTQNPTPAVFYYSQAPSYVPSPPPSVLPLSVMRGGKTNITIHCHVGDKTIVVSCGSGNQRLKWLGERGGREGGGEGMSVGF